MRSVKWILLIPLLLAAPALAQETKGTAPPVVPAVKAVTALSATSASQPVLSGEPQTPAEALESAKKGVEYAKARNWFGMSSIAILVLVFILKWAGLFKKIGKRWIYIIVPALGVAAMLLSAFAGGVSWGTAWLVLTSAPCAALFSDLVKRGVLGQEPETPMKPVG